MPKEKRFYISEEFGTTMLKMNKILTREGKSLSQWIREQITNYVRVHEPGNNQQYLEWYNTHDSPYIAPSICGFNGCNNNADWLATYKDEPFKVCHKHYERVETSENWTKWRKLS